MIYFPCNIIYYDIKFIWIGQYLKQIKYCQLYASCSAHLKKIWILLKLFIDSKLPYYGSCWMQRSGTFEAQQRPPIFLFQPLICLLATDKPLFTGKSTLNIINSIHLWFICINTHRFPWNASECMDWLKVIDYAIFIGMDIAKCYDTSKLFILLVWPMRSDILIRNKKIFLLTMWN